MLQGVCRSGGSGEYGGYRECVGQVAQGSMVATMSMWVRWLRGVWWLQRVFGSGGSGEYGGYRECVGQVAQGSMMAT